LKDSVAINKAVHFAFTTPDFDAFFAKLQNMTLDYSDWPGNLGKVNIRADGVKQIYFQDPDGYWLEVNSVGDLQET
jgi:catechol 2,3-dioxygenase-like lactoylglutathione lyase family enzyme